MSCDVTNRNDASEVSVIAAALVSASRPQVLVGPSVWSSGTIHTIVFAVAMLAVLMQLLAVSPLLIGAAAPVPARVRVGPHPSSSHAALAASRTPAASLRRRSLTVVGWVGGPRQTSGPHVCPPDCTVRVRAVPGYPSRPVRAPSELVLTPGASCSQDA